MPYILLLMLIFVPTANALESTNISSKNFDAVVANFPEQVCELMYVDNCYLFTLEITSIAFVDLNKDEDLDLVFSAGGGSCGASYFVFGYEGGKWHDLGGWCGADTSRFKILKSSHHGFLDIADDVGIAFSDSLFYRNYRLKQDLNVN